MVKIHTCVTRTSKLAGYGITTYKMNYNNLTCATVLILQQICSMFGCLAIKLLVQCGLPIDIYIISESDYLEFEIPVFTLNAAHGTFKIIVNEKISK